ncbi:MAG TPA: response regulator [Phenylobacterium sp.]|nr:response regulator [Phenylobacterium sp.]
MTEALTGVRLLLVEDEAMVAMMVEDLLADLGCVVVEVAGTLSRGLALASDAALPIDGAILDVNLGGEKVYPVAEALAARGVPFIFATGYGLAGISEAFSHVPALAKPYEQSALERILTAAIHRPSAA